MHEWTEGQIMAVLQEQGLLNKKHIKKSSYILVCCPFHQDKNPSFSIDFRKGVGHCFGGCFSGTFTQFIYKLLGTHDRQAVEYVRRYQKNDDYKFEELPRRNIKERIVLPNWDDLDVGEEILAKFDHTDWVYSKNRGISESVCRQFRLGFDFNWGAVTFPLMMNGRCIAICRRVIKNKKFNIPPELNERKPLVYLDEATALAGKSGTDTVVVVESIYNALTCFTYDIPAVATMGTPTNIQAEILINSRFKKVLLASDGDKAGRKFNESWSGWLKDKKIANIVDMPDGKDVNDLVMEDKTGKWFNEIIGKKYNETRGQGI